MAGIGEKIYDVDSQTVQQLDEQLNDTNTGLAGKVSQLEATADLSNVNPYDPAKSYVAGNLALVDGRLQRANKATTGAINLADWEDPSPVAAVTANRAMVSDDEGQPIASDVTDEELAKIRGGAAIQDDDITDDDAFLHNAAGTMKQTGFPALWRWITEKVTGAASTILTDDLTPDKLLRTDADGKVAEMGVRLFDASHRMRQDTSVTDIAADDRDILTKKDGDELYQAKGDLPINEVFCLGVIRMDTSGASTATPYGFKYRNPVIFGINEVSNSTDMDYTVFNISSWKPVGHTLSAIWIDISGEERDNKFAYQHTLNTSGAGAEIRVYSADNSDWAGDNAMGMDDAVMWVKIWAVASS